MVLLNIFLIHKFSSPQNDRKFFYIFFNSVKTDEPQAVPFAHFPGLAGSPPEIGKISHSSEDRSQSQEIPRFPKRREKETSLKFIGKKIKLCCNSTRPPTCPNKYSKVVDP
jgi:hypothetical protein